MESDRKADTQTQGEEMNLKYETLEDAIYDLEGVQHIVPTWVPKGYRLFDLVIDENPLQKIYVAVYSNGEKKLKIVVQSYQNGYPEQIEQSDGIEETCISSDVIYHFFEDLEQTRVAWIDDSYECYITGELSIDELKKMVDSIRKG